jgi:hypothetical protein
MERAIVALCFLEEKTLSLSRGLVGLWKVEEEGRGEGDWS